MIFLLFTLIINNRKKESIMKVKVNEDKCIGCGNCVALSESQIFDFNDAGLAECIQNPIPKDLEETAKEAIIQCPTGAIEEETE